MRRKTEDPKVTWSLKSSKALLDELDKEAKEWSCGKIFFHCEYKRRMAE